MNVDVEHMGIGSNNTFFVPISFKHFYTSHVNLYTVADGRLKKLPAWHWGSAGRVPGPDSIGPPSESHPVLYGPLEEVLSHLAGSSKEVQNVAHTYPELPNLGQQEKYLELLHSWFLTVLCNFL